MLTDFTRDRNRIAVALKQVPSLMTSEDEKVREMIRPQDQTNLNQTLFPTVSPTVLAAKVSERPDPVPYRPSLRSTNLLIMLLPIKMSLRWKPTRTRSLVPPLRERS